MGFVKISPSFIRLYLPLIPALFSLTVSVHKYFYTGQGIFIFEL